MWNRAFLLCFNWPLLEVSARAFNLKTGYKHNYLLILCIVACPPPESGTETEPVPQSLNCSAIGTVYTYECSDCYFLTGLNTTCQSFGNWSLAPPTCEEGTHLAVIIMGISLCIYSNTL